MPRLLILSLICALVVPARLAISEGADAPLRERIREAVRAESAENPDGPGALPSDFPAISEKGDPAFDFNAPLGGGAPESSNVRRLLSNRESRELLTRSRRYSRSSVRAHFEALLKSDRTPRPQRLIYAVEAARAGSEIGIVVLLDALDSPDAVELREAVDALVWLVGQWDKVPPDWVPQLATSVLSDSRTITYSKPWSNTQESCQVLRVAEEAGLPYALGAGHAVQALPFMVKKLGAAQAADDYARALGDLGDARAVAPMLERLKVIVDMRESLSLERNAIMSALGQLKAREAVPFILEHLDLDGSIETLEEIGDPAAIPVLRGLIIQGEKLHEGANQVLAIPDLSERACLALATLDRTWDAIPHLLQIVQNGGVPEWHRTNALHRIATRMDARCVEPLLETIRKDLEGNVVAGAVSALVAWPRPESVEGLISCLDLDYSTRSSVWTLPGEKSPSLRQRILDALVKLTAEDLGPESSSWRTWWAEHRATWTAPK